MAEEGHPKGIFIIEMVIIILCVGLLLFAYQAPYSVAFRTIFIAIVLEALPFMLVGTFIGGIVEVFLPEEKVWKLVPKNKILAVILSGLLGLALPVCECGVVVVMRRLVKKGMPFFCAITYMLAAPILNVVVLGSTALAFQGKPEEPARVMVALRGGMGYLIAVVVGLLCAYLFTRESALLEDIAADQVDHQPSATASEGHEEHGYLPHVVLAEAAGVSLKTKLGAVATHAALDFIEVGRFLILGAAVAAGLQTFVSRGALLALGKNPAASISTMMVLAVMLNLCSEADAFVAASFVQFTVASKLAFMVLGPMFDIKLLLMYLSVFKKRLILFLPIATSVLVFVLCYGLHLLR